MPAAHGLIHHSHPDGSPFPASECPFYRAAREGVVLDCGEDLFVRLDGIRSPVECWATPILRDGRPERVTCTFVDASQRRRAERGRDGSDELLSTFLQAVPGMVYARSRVGQLLVAHRGTAELIGRPMSDFTGKADAEFPDDASQAAIMETDRQIMEAGCAEVLDEAVNLSDG
jgi:PAS domain-containing protein